MSLLLLESYQITKKKSLRVDTPENPKNPWIDMMIVSENGLMQMLSLSDTIKAKQFKQFIEQEYPKINTSAAYAKASSGK